MLFRSPFPADSLVWTACNETYECATLSVPLDHDAPGDTTLGLSLLRAPARDRTRRIGSLVVNPGGPGGSGTGLAFYAPYFFPAEILDRFDIVGFDPRGTNASEPAIDCVDDLSSFVALDLTPDDREEREALIAENKALAAGCQERSAALLPYVDTSQVVRDIDMLREALGEEKLTYFGYSYGTFLGALYADRFPDRVRALALDGAVDPTLDGERLMRGQAIGFDEQLEAFFEACAADERCAFHSGEDPAQAFDELAAAIDAAPLRVRERTLGPGETWYAVTDALYSTSSWGPLADALAAAERGDGGALLQMADDFAGREEDGSYSDFVEQFLAISAIETEYPETLEAYDAIAADVARVAPRLGTALIYNTMLPLYWPLSPRRTPAPVRASGAPPIVVIGNLGDPATPYAWAESLAGQLESGVLMTYEGDGHTIFARGVDCIDDRVIDYLVDLQPPPAGARCAVPEEAPSR